MPRPQAHAPHSRRRRWRVTEARAALDALVTSGLSVSAFAEREGPDEERLYRWRRRFARERKAEARAVTPPATPAIIELRAATSPSSRRAEIWAALELTLDDYLVVRDRLIDLDLIAFDGTGSQVLSLPPASVPPTRPLVTQNDFEDHDPATIRRLLQVLARSTPLIAPSLAGGSSRSIRSSGTDPDGRVTPVWDPDRSDPVSRAAAGWITIPPRRHYPGGSHRRPEMDQLEGAAKVSSRRTIAALNAAAASLLLGDMRQRFTPGPASSMRRSSFFIPSRSATYLTAMSRSVRPFRLTLT